MGFIGIDHVVLTVGSIEKSLYFYCTILGMSTVTFENGRRAIVCGSQKMNLHEVGQGFEPQAFHPTPGSMDICFISDTPLSSIMEQLKSHHIAVIEGPVEKTGARGKLLSIYVRDPDQNLVEISTYQSASSQLISS